MIKEYRCPKCHRKLLYLEGKANIKCPKCKSIVEIDTLKNKVIIKSQEQRK